MTDLVDLLEACHFRLLSAEDWDTAQAEEFTVRKPRAQARHSAGRAGTYGTLRKTSEAGEGVDSSKIQSS